ncbi:hypothetical protein GALL_414610 [mine drainage metagenome]|uniref:Uncharacterized protein n=1 Tax=mine drainage metagenome TaxID=410659 RepID=A0A1J5PZK6_9ZZZZ
MANKLFLGPLGAIFGARLFPILDTLQIKGATHYVIADARKILHTATTHQYDGVLLKIMSLTTDVGDDLEAIRKAHLRNLAKCRVGLLWRCRIDTGTDSSALRRILHRRAFGFDRFRDTPLANQLIDGWHYGSL